MSAVANTIYILAGGNDRRYDAFGEKLQLLVKTHKKSPKILDVYFSRDESVYEQTFHNWDEWYDRFFGGGIERQFATQDNFMDQVAWADVIFLHGGNTLLMKEKLAPFENLKEAFTGKVVIGSSAGGIVIARHYYSPSLDTIIDGIGAVNAAVVFHYGSVDDGETSLDEQGWSNAVEKTKAAAAEDESVILLPEGTFVTFVI